MHLFLSHWGYPKEKTPTTLLLCLWNCGSRVQRPSYSSGWTTECHRQSNLFDVSIGWQSPKPIKRYIFGRGGAPCCVWQYNFMGLWTFTLQHSKNHVIRTTHLYLVTVGWVLSCPKASKEHSLSWGAQVSVPSYGWRRFLWLCPSFAWLM